MRKYIIFLALFFLDCQCSTHVFSQEVRGKFTLWATSDAHVGTDLKSGRKSLETAIKQSEGRIYNYSSINWDIMLHLGDISGAQYAPDDEEGFEIQKQLHSGVLHKREDIYNLIGNHDASFSNQPEKWWYNKWVDPFGLNKTISGVDSNLRPFKLVGNSSRYYFLIGNILVIMLSDENQGPKPAGRGTSKGGYPTGKIEEETFYWWVNLVEQNQDKIIITCSHHMLRNTTTASGYNEGTQYNVHGFMADGAPEGSSYLYFVGDEANSDKFENYFLQHPGAIDLWLGGHTHLHPLDSFGGKKLIERKYGVTFINVSALTRYHNTTGNRAIPMSRILNFEHNSSVLEVELYLHSNQFDGHRGFYTPMTQRIQLSKVAVLPATMLDTISSTADVCDQDLGDNMQLFPNPINEANELNFSFCTKTKVGSYTFSVYDISGKRITQLNYTSHASGKQKHTFDISYLTKGVYLFVVEIQGVKKNFKLIK